MKKSIMIGLVMGLLAVPTLAMAGGAEGQYILLASNRLSDQELRITTGQGLTTEAPVRNQPEGRIVIWDDWAHSAAGGKGINAASPGQVSINYATGQATMTASTR